MTNKQKQHVPEWPDNDYIRHVTDKWKDRNAYKKYRDLKNMEYAWEFLRRSPEYLADYFDLAAECRAKEIEGTPEWYEMSKARGEKWDLRQLYDPKMSSLMFREIKEKPYYRERRLNLWEPEPEVQRITKSGKFKQLTAKNFYEIDENGERTRATNPYVVIAFDARKLITPMLDEAKDILEKKQAALLEKGKQQFPKRNPAKQNFPRYLQVIDALIHKAKPSEIIRVTYADKEEKLLDSDYKQIAQDIQAALRYMQEYAVLCRSKQ